MALACSYRADTRCCSADMFLSEGYVKPYQDKVHQFCQVLTQWGSNVPVSVKIKTSNLRTLNVVHHMKWLYRRSLVWGAVW
jgi:hypothetical protein